MPRWGDEQCPGAGMTPLDQKDYDSEYVDEDGETRQHSWTWGTCPVCFRTLCAVSKSGKIWPHKREKVAQVTWGHVYALNEHIRTLQGELARLIERMDDDA